MEHGDLYCQVVRSFTDGVVVLEFDGVIRFANPSAEALLGVPELQGRHIDDFLATRALESLVTLATEPSTVAPGAARTRGPWITDCDPRNPRSGRGRVSGRRLGLS